MRIARRARLIWGAAVVLLAAAGALLPVPAGAAIANGTKIMPLGDSITYGFRTGNDCTANEGGYRVGLWSRLVAAGTTANFVGSLSHGPTALGDKNHEGRCGYRIDEIAAGVNGWLSAAQPQIVLLHIGTNDMYQNYQVATAPDRLSSLIDQISAGAPSATIYVASIVPSYYADMNARIAAFNQAIPGLVRSKVGQGKNVVYVNMADALLLSDLGDGVHPTSGGYDKMAAVWFNALNGAAPNLLLSSGFESQTADALGAPWYSETSAPGGLFGVDRNLGKARSGVNNGWLATSGSGWNAIKQNVAVAPNTNYTLTAWVRSSANLSQGYFGAKTTGGAVLGEVQFGAAGPYTLRSVTFNSGSNSTVVVHVGYWGPGSSSWLQIDDWSLVKQ